MTVTAAEQALRRRVVLPGHLDREGALPMVGFPLLLIPLAVYNIIVFLMRDVSIKVELFRIPMLGGQAWPVALSDLLLALGIVLLLLEIVKGARPGAKFLMDHLLSLIVFGAAAAEFVMWPDKFGNSTYFLLVLLSMADFLGGIAQRTRRRITYVAAETVAVPRKAKRQTEARQPATVFEPKLEPVPVAQPELPPAPSAQSVAESVLMDHPAPKPVQGIAPSPEIPSPHLQPGNGTPSSPEEPR